MINDLIQDSKKRMEKSVESLKNDFSKMRTGRAHPSLLDQIMVSYYGTDTPLKQIANINVDDARTLSITPWEKSLIPAIEKAIMASSLGITPATTGNIIRLPLPPLTEERRKEMVRLARGEAENARIAVRNIRRDANNDIKSLSREKEISEDEDRRAQEKIQQLTDDLVASIDSILSNKEKDLMEV